MARKALRVLAGNLDLKARREILVILGLPARMVSRVLKAPLGTTDSRGYKASRGLLVLLEGF